MKPWTIVLLAILLTAPAQAQDRQGRGRGERGPAPGRPAPVYIAPPAPDRSQQQERMSPDERRQLRRDVFQHGREVYRERPGERGYPKGGR